MVIEKDTDGFFVASIPELKGCHSQAKSLDQLMERIKEAAELHIEGSGDKFEKYEFVGIQKLAD